MLRAHTLAGVLALALLLTACGDSTPTEADPSSTQAAEPGPLAEKLAAKKAEGMKMMPDEVKSLIRKSGEELAATDLLAKALKADAQAPDFALKDAMGNETTLAALRDKGPVVVVFYRGKW